MARRRTPHTDQQRLPGFDEEPPAPAVPLRDPVYFDGETYLPPRDCERLTGQLLRVFDVMRDGEWRTLRDLSRKAEGSEPAVSARLRDLRKARFGAFTVLREHLTGGLFMYRLVLKRRTE